MMLGSQLDKGFPLVGEKVEVRLFEESDLSHDYVSWLNNPETIRLSNQRFVDHSLESVTKYFHSFSYSPNLFLAIVQKETGKHIGTMTVYVNLNHETADVGVLLGDPSIRGTGCGKEAWCMLVNWLVTDCQVRKVTAGTLACNKAMVALMKAADMQYEATRAGQELIDGEPQDIVYYARFS